MGVRTRYVTIRTWLLQWSHSFVAPPLVFMTINIVLASLLSLIRTSDRPELLDQGILMLNLVATASISIVTLTFSLTVLSVQVASQTYSARLLLLGIGGGSSHFHLLILKIEFLSGDQIVTPFLSEFQDERAFSVLWH